MYNQVTDPVPVEFVTVTVLASVARRCSHFEQCWLIKPWIGVILNKLAINDFNTENILQPLTCFVTSLP